MDAYRAKLQTFVYASGTTMKPIFNLAKRAKHKRVAYAEGEEERVLRAVQVVVDENLARPTLIGRPKVIAAAHRRSSACAWRPSATTTSSTPRTTTATATTGRPTTAMTARKGVTAQLAKIEMRRRLTLIGAMLLHERRGRRHALRHLGHAPRMHLQYIDQVIGLREGAKTYACMNGADPARPPGDAGRHPRQLRPDAPSRSPRSRSWRPRRCCASA